ncbi:MAG: hypothetical protein RLY58_2422 [Pseudomonadota bacterium]|jgi:hypothetical protein
MIREIGRLTGLALDWALAVAMGCTAIRQQHTRTLDGPVKIDARDPDGFFIRVDHTDPIVFMQLVKTYKPDIGFCPDGTWRVHVRDPKGGREFITRWSENLEENLAHCVAIMMLGHEIEIPDDLPEKAA